MKRALLLGLIIIMGLYNVSELTYGSRTFNGTTDIITLPSNGNAIDFNGTGAFSISAWVYTTRSNVDQGVVNKWDNGGSFKLQYEVRLKSGTTLEVGLGNGTTTYGVKAGGTYSTNTWIQVGLGYYGNAGSCGQAANGYAPIVGGVRQAGDTIAFTVGANGQDAVVGATYTNAPSISAPLAGRVAELGMWNSCLTDNEWAMLGAGVPPNRVHAQNLVGYWPLYGFASPEIDLSGNILNGTLTGTALGDHCPCSKPGGARELGR